ncbi:MAG: histidine kinase [Saprospiraceae bacterium]|nr:histidine kinase [Saprospiraceae bacterium]
MQNKLIEIIKRIGPHLLFWAGVVSVYYRNAQIREWTEHFWEYMGWVLPVDIAAVYFAAYLLIPYFLLRKRYTTFLILFLISNAFFVLLENGIYHYIVNPYMEKVYDQPFFYLPRIWSIILGMDVYVFLFCGIQLYRYWVRDQKKQSELIQQSLSSELALLRSQINPHFLFNTLNNIDLLVFKDQQKASDSIVKLSEIMRYMLYEANTESVPLYKEVQYLESMVDLIRLRVKDPNFIQFEVNGNPQGKMIPPMLLVPFVENAYKHGKKTGQAPGISIKLEIGKVYYQLYVFNRKDTGHVEAKDFTGGIGLNNVKRRLDLLYPNEYKLDIKDELQSFEVSLRLPIGRSIEEAKTIALPTKTT